MGDGVAVDDDGTIAHLCNCFTNSPGLAEPSLKMFGRRVSQWAVGERRVSGWRMGMWKEEQGKWEWEWEWEWVFLQGGDDGGSLASLLLIRWHEK